MTDRIPTEIGKYRILELVGEGAMGVVYRATDSVLGRTVAIKVMSASIARQEDLRQRFLREAQAAGSLQHPNVVTIYDLGEVDGHLFIAMEFVYGSDLERLMELSEPLKLQAKLDIVVDVLTGLFYAHRKGIVHRDIKPANIRVGDDGRAKIMDFGVAHLASSSITRTGLVVGTPSYMAPEQVMGGKAVPGTDIFAVGAVLYQLLTGNKPFEAPTLQGMFYKIVTDMPQPITEIMPGLPPALDRIVQKAMAKKPEERYADSVEMANEISAVRAQLSGAPYPRTISLASSDTSVSDRGASAPPPVAAAAAPSAVDAPTRPARRVPWLPVGGIAAVLVAIAWFTIGSDDGDTQPSTPAVPVAPVEVAQTSQAGMIAPSPPRPSGSGERQVDGAGEVTDADRRTPVQDEAASPSPAFTSEPEENIADRRRRAGPLRVPPPAARKTLRDAAREALRERNEAAARRRFPLRNPADRAPVFQQGSRTAVTSPGEEPRQALERPAPQVVTRPSASEGAPASAPPPPAPPPAAAPSAPLASAPPASARNENPAAEVASAVAAYARAIESRDLSAVRRAYPGLTPEQARGFQQFFESAKSINVTFRVVGLEANGNSADARLVGSYEYVTEGSRTLRQPVSFAAALRYDGSAWRLISVR